MSSADFYLSKIADTTPDPSVTAGASGYFSTPSTRLDPHLFNGDVFRDDVRKHITQTLLNYWATKYNRPQDWTTIWVAGSGISYQWSASRGNGDLDILVGIDWITFFVDNPKYRGMPEDDVADEITNDLKENLWPLTALTNFHGQTYEVTYYVNHNASDIRNINPYAAYNLTTNQWTIRPPVLPESPKSLYPKTFWAAVAGERAQARRLVQRYVAAKNDLDGSAPYSPGARNAQTAMRMVVDQAAALFNDIHLGRRNAFSPGGSGYGDFYNFRWQAAKQSGVIEALHTLTSLDVESRKASETDLYGKPIDDAHEALAKAALWAQGRE